MGSPEVNGSTAARTSRNLSVRSQKRSGYRLSTDTPCGNRVIGHVVKFHTRIAGARRGPGDVTVCDVRSVLADPLPGGGVDPHHALGAAGLAERGPAERRRPAALVAVRVRPGLVIGGVHRRGEFAARGGVLVELAVRVEVPVFGDRPLSGTAVDGDHDLAV